MIYRKSNLISLHINVMNVAQEINNEWSYIGIYIYLSKYCAHDVSTKIHQVNFTARLAIVIIYTIYDTSIRVVYRIAVRVKHEWFHPYCVCMFLVGTKGRWRSWRWSYARMYFSHFWKIYYYCMSQQVAFVYTYISFK